MPQNCAASYILLRSATLYIVPHIFSLLAFRNEPQTLSLLSSSTADIISYTNQGTLFSGIPLFLIFISATFFNFRYF